MKIWVTRDEEQGGPLSAALAEVGLEPVLEPVVRRTKIDDAADVLRTLSTTDWLVLTSAFAAQCLATKPRCVARVAVVGPATLAAARELGLRIELPCLDHTVQSLFDQLSERCRSGTICYPRSSLASPPQPWPGVRIISPAVYETKPVDFDRSIVNRVDAAAVTSPSAVRAMNVVQLPIASIGPTTTRAVHDLGMHIWVEAAAPSFAALATVIAANQADRSRRHRA